MASPSSRDALMADQITSTATTTATTTGPRVHRAQLSHIGIDCYSVGAWSAPVAGVREVHALSFGSTKPRRSYSRTGLNALKARVKIRGLDAIDKRTSAERALVEWRREMIEDLGGDDEVSAQQRAIAGLVVRTKLYVDSLDAWIMSQPSLVLARRRAVLPVLVERQRLADSLARMLGQLGLERRARPAPRLADYLAGASKVG